MEQTIEITKDTPLVVGEFLEQDRQILDSVGVPADVLLRRQARLDNQIIEKLTGTLFTRLETRRRVLEIEQRKPLHIENLLVDYKIGEEKVRVRMSARIHGESKEEGFRDEAGQFITYASVREKYAPWSRST